MNKRVVYCDVLRLFAIISVVAIHIFADIRDFYLVDSKNLYLILTFFDSLTRTGVPLFFMLTGAFMLNRKIINYREYFINRVLRLIILYVIFSLFYYFIECILTHTTFSFIGLFSVLTCASGKYHLWFMPVIILIYLLIPYFHYMIDGINKKQLKNLIIIIFIFGNVLFTINKVFSLRKIKIFDSFFLPSYIMYFNYLFLGYYLYNHKINKRKIVYILGIISVILMPFVSLLFSQNGRNDQILSAASILPIFPSISVFILFKDNYKRLHIPRIIENFAVRTNYLVFYVYLVHVFIIEVFNKIFYHFYDSNIFIVNIIFIIFILFFTLLFSYIFAFVFDKIYLFIFDKLINHDNNKKCDII